MAAAIRAQLVVISDIHLHTWSAFSQGSGVSNSRLQQTLAVIRKSLQRAQELGALWVHPGDIIHTAGFAHNVVFNALVEAFIGFEDVPKVGIWGNHDARGRGEKITADETVLFALSKAVANFTLLDDSTFEYQGVRIYGAGFQPRSEFLELGPGGDVGIFHQTVVGSKTADGYELTEGVDAKALLELYRTVFIGHIHHPQGITDSGKLLLVPGSPEHQNFGDAGEHGYWVVTLKKTPKGFFTEKYHLEESDSPQFITVDSFQKVSDQRNFYRVMGATGTPADIASNVNVVATPTTIVEQRNLITPGASTEQILQAWVNTTPPEGAYELRGVLDAGLQLLAGADPTNLKPYRLVEVRGKDFMSYKHLLHEVRAGVTLVTGRSKDFQSNGAGKTTLWEMVYWALFGKTTKDLDADRVIRRGAKLAEVMLTLEGPEEEVVLVERVRSSGTTKMRVTLGDGRTLEGKSATEVTQKLQDRLGITPEIFQALAYFSQEKVLLFNRATDGDRKNILRDLTGLTSYQTASEKAAEEARSYEARVASIASKIAGLEQSLGLQRVQLEEAQLSVGTWETTRTAILDEVRRDLEAVELQDPRLTLIPKIEEVDLRVTTAYEMMRRRLEEQTPGLIDVQSEVERRKIENTLANISASARGANGAIQLLGFTLESVEVAVARIGEVQAQVLSAKQEANAAREGWQLAEARRVEATANLAHHSRSGVKLAAGVCTSCGQDIKAELVERLQQEHAETTRALEQAVTAAQEAANLEYTSCSQLQSVVSVLEAELDKLRSAQTHLTEFNYFMKQRSQLRRALEDTKSTAERIVEMDVKARLERYKVKLNARLVRAQQYFTHKVNAWERQLQATKDRISSIEARENPHKETIRSLENLARTTQASISEQQQAKAKEEKEVALMRYWAKAFSKQGIQSLLMEEIAAAFNDMRSNVFPLLTHGVYDVQFSATSRTQAGELREKTDFLVWQHGLPVPYEELSGGQRRRIDLGVMLTLSLAVSKRNAVPGVLGVMILDEVFGFLDDDGAEALFTTLQEIARTIPSIYAITHDAHLQSLFPQVLHVEQDALGISSIAE